MLTLSLNSVAIPIPPDFSMQLTWKSPVCDFEKIPQGYGQGFSFPINEHTRALFGNPERFSKYRSGADQKFPGFEVRFSGVLLMAGTLKINSCSKEAYEATLIDQLGVLSEKEAERSILEIPEFAAEIAWANKAAYDPNVDDYCCFPLRNPDFFKDKGKMIPNPDTASPETEVEILRYVFQNSALSKVNNLAINGTIAQEPLTIDVDPAPTVAALNAQKMSVVSPFFFLNKVIRKALKNSLFYLDNNYLDTDANLRSLCIYNNYDITLMSFGVTQTTEVFLSTEHDDIDNLSPYLTVQGKSVTGYFRTYPADLKVVAKNHLPKIKTGELLISTQNFLNVVFHFLPNKTVNVVSREAIITGVAFDLEKYFLGNWVMGEKKNLAIKLVWEHDDNDLQFAERYTDLSDRRGDMKSPVSSWPLLSLIANPKEGEIRFVTESGVYAEYGWATATEPMDNTLKQTYRDVIGWSEVSIAYQNGWYEYGREEVEEIKTAWSTPAGNWLDYIMFARILTARQQGNINAWRAKQQPFSPRLMLYNATNNTGHNENSDLSLTWDKPTKGIMAKYWKNWNPFWANRLPVSGEFDVPVNVLRYLIWNICQKYRTREGEFIIEEMSCEISVDKIGVLEVKGYKV